MYFIDRATLGKTFAGSLQEYRGKDTVILCLKDSSLLTCLTAAMQLRAWVYPLVFVPIYSEDGTHQMIGAIDEEGQFCSNPQNSWVTDIDQLPPEAQSAIRNQRQSAILSTKQQLGSYGMGLDKRQLNGRDVILMCDVLTNPTPLTVANQLLRTVVPRSLTIAIGNATPAVVDMIRVSADKTIVLDVLSGVVFDDDHYFTHPDAYTAEQKRTLTQHISTYWE